jgi:hypothetical protein
MQGVSFDRLRIDSLPRSETYFVAYVAATRDEATKQMGAFGA